MLFNIILHPSAVGISAALKYISEAISAAGHPVIISVGNIDPKAANIFMEDYYTPADIDMMIGWKRANPDLKFGLMLQELYIDRQIPYLETGLFVSSSVGATSSNDDPFAPARQRIELMYRLAANCDFVWTFLERTAAEFRPICKNSFLFRYGFTYPVPTELRRAPKDIDVLFIGKATDHRRRIIAELGRRGVQVAAFGADFPNGYLPISVFDTMINRAKIGLNLCLTNNAEFSDGLDRRFSSCTRIPQFLDRALCLVSEDIPLDNPYRDVMVSAPLDDLADACLDQLQNDKWQLTAERQYTTYLATMDAAQLIGPVVEKTLALI